MSYYIEVANFLNEPAVVRSVDEPTTQATVVDASFKEQTLYAVSVAASNMDGLGLSDTVNVTTGEAPNSKSCFCSVI